MLQYAGPVDRKSNNIPSIAVSLYIFHGTLQACLFQGRHKYASKLPFRAVEELIVVATLGMASCSGCHNLNNYSSYKSEWVDKLQRAISDVEQTLDTALKEYSLLPDPEKIRKPGQKLVVKLFTKTTLESHIRAKHTGAQTIEPYLRIELPI